MQSFNYVYPDVLFLYIIIFLNYQLKEFYFNFRTISNEKWLVAGIKLIIKLV